MSNVIELGYTHVGKCIYCKYTSLGNKHNLGRWCKECDNGTMKWRPIPEVNPEPNPNWINTAYIVKNTDTK